MHLISLMILLLFLGVSSAAKILLIAPTASYSHQLPFHMVSKALLQRGHRVTLMTTDPLKINHENYTEIDLSVSYKHMRGDYDFVQMSQAPPTETVKMLRFFPLATLELQLNDTNVQTFIRSAEKFDLVIFERLGYLAYYGLIHKVGSPPAVGFITMSTPSSVYYGYGNPMNPAYMPDVWVGFSDHMDFWQRMYNTYFYLRLMYMWYFVMMPEQEQIMRQHFGPNVPPIHELERNFSLFIINNHFSMEYPRPHLPNIIELTGIHVATEQKPLPKDIKTFLDGAQHGVIYFSLGSNVHSNSLPEWKQRALVEAFRELPQRVLWKFENESLPDKPDNLMISKWLPQQDILAHPNVRLFITQGGLQSMNEATYHAIPLLVIPFFSDQAHNAAKVSQAEVGVWLDYVDVTKESVLHKVREILHDNKYKENMQRLSAVFREHKADSLDRAIWWIEYVVRHNGAKHMRSAALDLYWWQLLLLDVIGFVLLVAGIFFLGLYYTTRWCISVAQGSKFKVKKE